MMGVLYLYVLVPGFMKTKPAWRGGKIGLTVETHVRMLALYNVEFPLAVIM